MRYRVTELIIIIVDVSSSSSLKKRREEKRNKTRGTRVTRYRDYDRVPGYPEYGED